MEENKDIIQPQEEEFSLKDVIALCKRVWSKIHFVAFLTIVFMLLGFLSALSQKPVYKADCVFVPQTSNNSSSSSLSSLAALAGINLNNMSASVNLSPLIYPKLLNNVDLNKELINTKIHFKKYDEPITLLDYYTKPDSTGFTIGKAVGAVKKYTIGLPFVILGAIRGNKSDIGGASVSSTDTISVYSKEEYEVVKRISPMISLVTEKKEGYFSLTCSMGEPVAAAELCQATFNLLQKYVTDFKLKHARSTNEYINTLYDDAKSDYEEKQLALAQFTDSNHGLLTATAQIRRDQLRADYELSYALYTEMSKQLLQSQMKVKEDTPVLAAVKPVSVPVRKSNSRSKVLLGWTFVGLLLSVGGVLGYDWIVKQGFKFESNKITNWILKMARKMDAFRLKKAKA